ncbi:MAG: restriction endonuclease [Boseongicola sp. SB0677_bin_26]|nr:restriction endonuclease [Boseongicola sp. SB0665_bin_10]MYG25065.1 restriction endonuclease [Boseongicola sp. SB0677_bin_26]
MNELAVHPNVYATGGSKGLVPILERVWLREQQVGDGTYYIVSGFANYNGGVRFFPVFRRHVEHGGKVVAIFGGNARQRLTSRQVVQEMLECGVDVHVVNRKRLMHAKSYGSRTPEGEMLVVTSGNFTGPGMAQNVEMSLMLDRPTTKSMGFSWEGLVKGMFSQNWELYRPRLDDMDAPVWQLLYDERKADLILDETNEVTLVIRLGHADTVRVNAAPGSDAGRGTQYFWLSKDCYDFFPALTIPNRRGLKRTYSCQVSMRFVDLDQEHPVRVTFEAENNLDFRLGTGPLRHTGLAREGDIAAISRVGESSYELRLFRQSTKTGRDLMKHAVNFIGHQGKRYGFMANQRFERVSGRSVG